MQNTNGNNNQKGKGLPSPAAPLPAALSSPKPRLRPRHLDPPTAPSSPKPRLRPRHLDPPTAPKPSNSLLHPPPAALSSPKPRLRPRHLDPPTAPKPSNSLLHPPPAALSSPKPRLRPRHLDPPTAPSSPKPRLRPWHLDPPAAPKPSNSRLRPPRARSVFSFLSALPALFCLFLLFYLFSPQEAAAGCLAVALHECGHIVVFYRLRGHFPRLSTQAGGLLLSSEPMPPKEELFYAAGGAFANLLTLPAAYLLSFCAPIREGALLLFAFSFLYLAFNLLPIPPLDGAKLFFLLSARLLGEGAAKRLFAAVSGLLIAALLFLSLYFCLGSGGFLYGIFLSLRFFAAHLEAF